jgi:uncharacterized protein
MIIESIVTTTNPDGTANISPMGPVFGNERDMFELRPYAGSQTLDNLRQRKEGVVHIVDDALLFVRALTNRWEARPPMHLATAVSAPMLKEYLRAIEFRVRFLDDSSHRASVQCEIVEQHIGKPPRGICRGLNAVIEACILVSRVEFLPAAQIDLQLPGLQKIVDKTGSPCDIKAMELLLNHYRELTRLGWAEEK